MTTPTLRGVKGMPDLQPVEAERFRRFEAVAASLLGRAGFREVRTPLLEPLALFQRSVGESSDIVRKEMYTLKDLGERDLALRPEGTAGVVRAVVEHSMVAPGEELRLWYTGPMFRQERPQKGRLRQFHQIGCEVFGTAAPTLDAEIIALNWRLLEALGVGGLELRLGSLGGESSRTQYRSALLDWLAPHAPELCDDCRTRLQLNPLRVLDCKNPVCKAIVADAPAPLDALEDEDRHHFEAVTAALAGLGIPVTVDPRLVRGLDYYTRTVYEIQSGALGAQSAVSAGGRYDNLVASFGGQPAPAFGFALGLERLSLILGDDAAAGRHGLAWVALDDAARLEGLEWTDRLRSNGLTALLFQHKGSLKAQMRAADAAGCRYALIRGGSEREAGTVACRDLEDGRQFAVALDVVALVEALAG